MRIGQRFMVLVCLGMLMLSLMVSTAIGKEPAAAYWNAQQTSAILAKTGTLRLAPNLEALSQRERAALDLLLQAGVKMHDLYLQSRHKDALEQRRQLMTMQGDAAPENLEDLRRLFRIFRGPVLTTLDNQRQAFLPVAEETKGKNVYPWGIERETLEQFFAAHPEQRDRVLHLRSVVRETTPANIAADLAKLEQYPVLASLHPDLVQRLRSLKGTDQGFYGLPYSVAYADQIQAIYHLLWQAGEVIAPDDADFSGYLKQRARDLLSDNYEGGDAIWVRGRFGNLNAQIGSYETYDDSLYGIKSFFSMSILVRDVQRSAALDQAIGSLQALEDSLPYQSRKKVSSDIPIGVYNVIADFGQSRGTNTASILPNESHITRKFGRTILLRYNIQTDPELFANEKLAWDAVVAPEFRPQLTTESNFQRTLWHEIGHYMGPSRDRGGRTLDIALTSNSNLYEEMKSDLVSLFASDFLAREGFLTAQQQRSIYAAGIKRTLQTSRPRREQSYKTMQLMTFNYFLQHGVLSFNSDSGQLSIDYSAYPGAVRSLLQRLLDIQYQGDKAASDDFVQQYSDWDDNLHGIIAAKRKAALKVRYWQVNYAALGE
jgi:hypothetical protein